MDNQIDQVNWRRLISSLVHYDRDQLTELRNQIDMMIKQKEGTTTVEQQNEQVEQVKQRTKRPRIKTERIGNMIIRKKV
ncbi:MAG: hypothetical protein JST37_02535 [Bacteroidetes bacterium]|nr:hypothetical protein [Bacteroidota bacterium]MBS1980233.1 hypothetical protein [Bacteroidota bacterium]